MAGHSKWNNIKNRKGAVDAKKGKIFGELSKQIRIAVREGGSGDPKFNATLRVMMDKARAANMPKEKVQKAIERGLGKSASGASIQEIVYEGFGPGGVPLLIVSLTDNQNRTSSELKFILSRAGGSLGSPGSAMYMFSRTSEGSFSPTMELTISAEDVSKLKTLVDALLENEDVEDVYPGVALPEEE